MLWIADPLHLDCCAPRATARSEGHNDSTNHAVEAEDLSEDENQDEANEDALVDGVVLDALLTDQADSVARHNVAQAASETRAPVEVSRSGGLNLRCRGLGHEHREDETVDWKNTSHNNGDDGLEGQLGSRHGDRGNTHAGLRRAVRSANV